MSDWYEPLSNIRWDPTLSAEARRQVIRSYGMLKKGFDTFVETGTNDGGTPAAVHDLFKKIYTIEFIPSVHEQAKRRLEEFPNIECLQGDSADIIPEVLAEVNDSCVWWLDGHWSGATIKAEKDTPIVEELEFILNDPHPHIVLIDDARLFGNNPAYPTPGWVRNLATTRDIRYEFAYLDDIMRIVPV